MAAASTMGGQGGGAILQCTDERTAGLAAWQMGGPHNQTLTTPTLWQYPAPVPLEPMVPLPVPMPPMGFQLVRDPTTGGLLLLPTTGIEPVQQAVVWPSYPQPSSVLLPSLPPIPPPPLQLLSSASSDYLSSSTTLHQHTQTHSTRLVAVTTDAKRKIPMPIPAATLIKIETDATLDQTKTLQAINAIPNNNATVFADQNLTPLVTTHVIYQHPTNLILSQNQTSSNETTCRSQATSPVVCLTPPPDTQVQEEETSTVQDASNQTDTPICSEDDTTTQTLADVVDSKIKCEQEFEKPVQLNDEKETELRDGGRSDVTTTTKSLTSIAEQDECVEDVDCEPEEILNETPDVSQNPDLSGLRLLSNSIVEFESCRNTDDNEEQIEENTTTSTPTYDILESENVEPSVDMSTEEKQTTPAKSQMEDNLGGLDLLCALAEQRILEETVKMKVFKEKSKERKREKRKSKKHSSDEPKKKKMKSDKHRSEEREHKKRKDKYSSNKHDKDKDKRPCTCQSDSYRTYKTPKSEEEVRKFIASKSQRLCCKGDWPCMNAMELDMRMKLAELQREYREKQRELSKLKPKRHSADCSTKRSRKKSTHSLNSDRSSTPPPLLDKMDVPLKTDKDFQGLTKPPSLSIMPKLEKMYQASHSDTELSCDKYSSSKKRKVGRPKKVMSSSGVCVGTETIVAKKPKSSFVYNLLAAKEKFKLQNNNYPDATPPRYLEETFTIKSKKNKNNNIITEEVKSSKIRPQLKAEPTIKSYQDEEQSEWDTVTGDEEIEDAHRTTIEDDDMELEEVLEPVEVNNTENLEMHNEISNRNENAVKSLEKTVTSLTEPVEEIKPEKSVEEPKPQNNKCILTDELLDVHKLRVLTAMGGLFYAGQLNALEPPDVYSIILDGERGNKPHIMSREEILRDAIVEVAPKGPDDLPMGTRICAYWSQQYRCLYPGSIAEPGTPDPQLDGKFVCVAFDDGDSGTIAIEDIRLLPPDYPIIEYDPNPLLSLSKRKRRVSTSVSNEEKSQKTPIQVSMTSQTISQTMSEEVVSEKIDRESTASSESYKERKRLKKKKREKLRQKLFKGDKKKKKKHKCNDFENCKHRKHHKKHRKHKKHHEKSRDGRLVSSMVGEEEQKDMVQDGIDEDDILEESTEISSAQHYSNESSDVDEDYNDNIPDAEDEVTMDDIVEATKSKKSKKIRDRQESCESRSKMSAFLPARQLWGWAGKGYKRQRAKGRSKKSFYKSIQRGKEMITVGDAAVFLSTGRPDRPYIGRIEAMWELCGTMVVKVKWFYHPEETVGCPQNLQYPGALFESPHIDENDVQTIAHKCEVLPLKAYTERLGDDPQKYAAIYDNNDIYYLAGYYDPTNHTIKMEPGIPFTKTN